MKAGFISWTFSLNPKNFKSALGSTMESNHGTHHLKSWLGLQGYLGPSILIGQPRKLVVCNLALLFYRVIFSLRNLGDYIYRLSNLPFSQCTQSWILRLLITLMSSFSCAVLLLIAAFMMELAARCALSVGNGSLHESRLQSSRLCNFLSIFSNSNLFIKKRNISCYLF